MKTWRGKLVFLLIIYFAGFATAIYTLAPVPENQTRQTRKKTFAYSALKSDEFAQSFNTGMRKCLDFSKDVAYRAGRFIKQKYNDRQLRTDG
ncbi:hypothetical protein ES703_119709 [subsurface metagenome]